MFHSLYLITVMKSTNVHVLQTELILCESQWSGLAKFSHSILTVMGNMETKRMLNIGHLRLLR